MRPSSLRSVAALATLISACACRQPGQAPPEIVDLPEDGTPIPWGPGRGFPVDGPWVSFYGAAKDMGLLDKVADTFRIINLDADPFVANFTIPEIARLKRGGRNRVLSYLNVGACENFRQYWDAAPRGFVPCRGNGKAQRGAYHGYRNEVWMDPSDADHTRLLVEHVAPRLAAMGIDGFFLDNLEIVEHGTAVDSGACDPRCRQGGLELVARLRAAFPDHLIVMQNATGAVTRLGQGGGVSFPSLLDGVSHESPYSSPRDDGAEAELLLWKDLALAPGGGTFFIGTEDYVGSCAAVAKAAPIYAQSRARGFSPYVTDASAGQNVVCYWPF